MKARHFIDLISDKGEILKTYIFNEDFDNVKAFDKKMLKQFSKSKHAINVREIIYTPTIDDTDYKTYKSLKHMKYFKEFKEKYSYPKMYKTSYMRVLDGKSTYLNKSKSPYIADLFRFFADKLNKSFLEVASDLLDSEYFGKKNTLLDVLIAEKNITKDQAVKLLHDQANILENIKLADLNLENEQIYNKAKLLIK